MPGDNATEPVVYIVDDDESVRKAVARLVRSAGMRTAAFASPDDLLRHGYAGEPGCMILDVRLPGMSGFELHERLIASGHRPAVIFITAHPESRTQERAAPAVGFLEKPFEDQDLLRAIESALDVDRQIRRRPRGT